VDSKTLAFIGNEDANAGTSTTLVHAGNNVLVDATDDTGLVTVNGGGGIGLTTAGVGIAIPIVVLTKDTEAYIGNAADVEGKANGTDTMNVSDGTIDSTGGFNQKTAQGVAVQARSSEDGFTL